MTPLTDTGSCNACRSADPFTILFYKNHAVILNTLQGKNESEIFKVFANTTYDDFEKDAEAAMAGNGSLNFAPTVDSFSSTPFLPDHPFNILEQGGQVRKQKKKNNLSSTTYINTMGS